MTNRERMLAAMRGEPTDLIPWAPRMDLWAVAQQARGTMPKRFAGMNIPQIAAELGVCCHCQRADYTTPPNAENLMLRGLGLDNHQDYTYRVELKGLPVDFRVEGESLITEIKTSAGELRTRLTLSSEMRKRGISLPFVEEFGVKSVDDLEALGEIFEHLEVIPTPEAYAAFHRKVGDTGLAVGNGIVGASPMHLIYHDIMAQEDFIFAYTDDYDKLARCARRMEPFYGKVLDAVLQTKAEMIYWGCNYDDQLTWPRFFETEIAPWLKMTAGRLHSAGKFILTHTDGENEGLLPYYPGCDLDVCDSVCPAPMTRCELPQLRKGFGPKTSIWGGLCSIAFLENSMSDAVFNAYIEKTFAELGSAVRVILGVSDNVPPDVNMDRLERIKERIEAFGPVIP